MHSLSLGNLFGCLKAVRSKIGWRMSCKDTKSNMEAASFPCFLEALASAQQLVGSLVTGRSRV